jgi:hypothetical protein
MPLFSEQLNAAQYFARNCRVFDILSGLSPFAPNIFNILGADGRGEGVGAPQ